MFISFNIAGDGSDNDILIDCLPYVSKHVDTFNIGYCNAVFVEPSNNKAFTSLFAGTWSGNTSMYIGGSLDGRNWALKCSNLITAGQINISGFYEIA